MPGLISEWTLQRARWRVLWFLDGRRLLPAEVMDVLNRVPYGYYVE